MTHLMLGDPTTDPAAGAAWAQKFMQDADSLELSWKRLLIGRSGMIDAMHTLGVPFTTGGGFELSPAGVQSLASRVPSWGGADDQSLLDLQEIVRLMVASLRGAANGSRESKITPDGDIWLMNDPAEALRVGLQNNALTLFAKGDVPTMATGVLGLGALPLLAIAGLALAGVAIPLSLIYLAKTLVETLPVVVDKITTAWIEHELIQCLNTQSDPNVCLKMTKALEDKNVNGKKADADLIGKKNEPTMSGLSTLQLIIAVGAVAAGAIGTYKVLEELKVIKGHVKKNTTYDKSNPIKGGSYTLSNPTHDPIVSAGALKLMMRTPLLISSRKIASDNEIRKYYIIAQSSPSLRRESSELVAIGLATMNALNSYAYVLSLTPSGRSFVGSSVRGTGRKGNPLVGNVKMGRRFTAVELKRIAQGQSVASAVRHSRTRWGMYDENESVSSVPRGEIQWQDEQRDRRKHNPVSTNEGRRATLIKKSRYLGGEGVHVTQYLYRIRGGNPEYVIASMVPPARSNFHSGETLIFKAHKDGSFVKEHSGGIREIGGSRGQLSPDQAMRQAGYVVSL